MFVLVLKAQDKPEIDKYIETGMISVSEKDGFSWHTKVGSFLFKPYTLIQTRAVMNYYDDEGLSLADEDNVLNSGFSIPFALIGFAGQAFDRITYNVALNAATSGGALLNQAWFDVNVKDELRIRVGKFKTPFNQAYLVQNGQTLFPSLPYSLSARVNVPFSINSVNPTMATGFDIGAQLHGVLQEQLAYQLGIFNGTGSTVNTATNTLSDENGLPSLLYAARLAYMPFGPMPLYQGNPTDFTENKLLVGVSGSYNVEANYESSNDLRAGFELSWLYKRFYFCSEAYMLSMDFVERQQESPVDSFWGSYAQAGYFVSKRLQPALRLELFDRNGIDEKGMLYTSAIGLNYYIVRHNLKLQTMYWYMGKIGHESEADANDDDNSLSEHQLCVQLQFAF